MGVGVQFLKDHGLQCDEQLWVSIVLLGKFLLPFECRGKKRIDERDSKVMELVSTYIPGGSPMAPYLNVPTNVCLDWGKRR